MGGPGSAPDVATLLPRYPTGALDAAAVLRLVCAAIERRGADAVWIDVVPPDEATARPAAARERSRTARR